MGLFDFTRKKNADEAAPCDCRVKDNAAKNEKPVKEKETGCCCGSCSADSMAQAEKAKRGGASVKVLGSGCAKCNQLEAAAKEALEAHQGHIALVMQAQKNAAAQRA